jgi:hypothetical protein
MVKDGEIEREEGFAEGFGGLLFVVGLVEDVLEQFI